MSKRVSNKKGKGRVRSARSWNRLGFRRTQGIANLQKRQDELDKMNPDEKVGHFTVAETMQGIAKKLKEVLPRTMMRRHQGK